MGTEQYSDLVLYRRGAGLLLNPYSPVSEELANNDGIYLKYPYSYVFWDLFKWGDYGSENKFPFISNETGAYYPEASNDYVKKIKTNGVNWPSGENFKPFIYFSLNNNGIIKKPNDYYTITQLGYKLSGAAGTHNIYDSGVFEFTKRYGKAEYQGDYNPFSPYNPSGTTNYDSVTISALNSNPQFYNFRPVTNAIGYQAVSTEPSSIQYPNGRTRFVKCEGTVSWSPVYGFICDYNTTQINIYVNNYNPARNGFVKYGTLPFDESQFVLLTDNSDIHHRPVWWKEYGTEFTSDTIPYNQEIQNIVPYLEIILRDNNDTTQPEYDISSNPLTAGFGCNFSLPDEPGYLEKVGVYTALRTPNNETPFVMRNQIMKFDLKASMFFGCPDACWHSNKVVKIKLKYQNGTVSIYKNSGNIVNTGYPEVEVSLKINWNDYEEEIVDNIDIFFDHTEGGQDYGILWSKEIECPAGQAKRLVDVCVLEIRDKT